MPVVCVLVVRFVDDAVENARLWSLTLEALDAASPLVEDAAVGLAFLEMRGIEGGAARWLPSVREALSAYPETNAFDFRLGSAANKFVARAAARVADETIVPSGEEAAFVAPLPLHALDLERDVVERLVLLGIRTLGDVAALPHGPFVRRFGAEAARWHANARGIDERPLVPRPRTLRIDRSVYGEGTAEREDQVLFALRTLVGRIADDVAYAGKRCGLLRLALECEDSTTLELPTTLARPTAQSTTMFDLLRARLEGHVLSAPVVGMRLSAERLEEGGTEIALFTGGDPDPEVVAVALARLEAALGPNSALRARVQAGNRYETRFVYEPFSMIPSEVMRAAPAPRSEIGTLAYRMLEPREVEVRIERGRPARVAGGAVLDVAGPWRVDELWWAQVLDEGGVPYACDAYDVLLDDGSLRRIVFERGRWYLRGIYD
jgi:protein ImuB